MYMKNIRLYRSRQDKIIAGVCGGLGKYFEIDSVLPRLVFIALTIGSGVGLVIYLIMYFMVPLEPSQPDVINITDNLDKRTSRRSVIAGIIIVLFGLGLLSKQFWPNLFYNFGWNFILPIIIIIFGFSLLIKRV